MSRLTGILVSVSVFESSVLSNLNYSNDDAMRLAQTLESFWSPESGTHLRTLIGRVSRYELVAQLHQAVQDSKPDDTFVFYFSGHGIMHRNQSYLVLSDSQIDQASSTCIAVSEIVQILSPVQKKIIIIDACKAGIQTSEGFTLSTLSSLPGVGEFVPNRAIALISAGSAYENTQAGVFTDSLIDGIRHFAFTVGRVDISFCFQYVKDDVSIRTGGRQNPSMSFSGSSLMLEFSASTPSKEKRTQTVPQTNVLAIFANPKGSSPLRLGNEDRVIRECIERSIYRSNVALDVRHAVRIDDFARALLEKDYRIVHFSGHGTGVGLAFEDEMGNVQVVPKDALAETLSAYSPPIECVILNACYSDIHRQQLSIGIPYTIAMSGAISDDSATEFTRGFYDAIGAGKTIEFAYQEGCRRIKLKNLPDAEKPVFQNRTTDKD